MPVSPLRLLAGRGAFRPRRAVALACVCLAAMGASLALRDGMAGVLAAGLVPILAAIAVIDARHLIIPDRLNLVGFALGLAHAAVSADDALAGMGAALVRGLALGALFFMLRVGYRALRGREGLGLGDVKLAVVAGAWLGVAAIPLAIEIAALSALFALGLWHLFQGPARRRAAPRGDAGMDRPAGRGGGSSRAKVESTRESLAGMRELRVPFGVFLAPAIWIGWSLEAAFTSSL